MKRDSPKPKSINPLSGLTLPIEGEPSRYPWPLITWLVEKEAIAKLKELRREFVRRNAELVSILRKRTGRRGRGRPKDSSPLYTEQSFVIAIAHDVLRATPAEILTALCKEKEPEDYKWFKNRLRRGRISISELSDKERSAWLRFPKDTLLGLLREFPASPSP